MRTLLTTKIDLNHVNKLGWTTLLEAVILGDGGPVHTQIVRALVDAGADADVNLADRHGVTPLAHAELLRHKTITEVLRRAGAKGR